MNEDVTKELLDYLTMTPELAMGRGANQHFQFRSNIFNVHTINRLYQFREEDNMFYLRVYGGVKDLVELVEHRISKEEYEKLKKAFFGQ